MMYMLDTNICIYAIKNNPQLVLMNLNKYTPEEICISSVTYSELMYGVNKSKNVMKNRIALTILLSNIEIIPFDSCAAECYGEIRADLEKKGNVIGSMDMLIAAHAKSNNYILVTNNEKEFLRVSGLQIENWSRENG